jgi:hypothetical protein
VRHLLKILACVSAIAIYSCSSDPDHSAKERGDNYIPLQKGSFHVYDVSEIRYTLGVPETLSYALKTVVADSFVNGSGDLTYVIHRSTRKQENTAWTPLDTWSIRKTRSEAVVSEENIPYVVLKFPVAEGLTWNGNEYNNEVNPVNNSNDDTYSIKSIGTTQVVGDQSFSDCLTVSQEDNEEFVVYYDKRTEIYARYIGLVYKEKIQLHYCTDETKNCIGKQIVEEGIIYKQSLKSYGKE